MKPTNDFTKYDDGATLAIRYAELVRLREVVKRLETEKAVVRQFEFEDGCHARRGVR